MRARLVLLAAYAVFPLVVCGCAAAATSHSAAAGHSATAPRYYLSLGDSLAQGMQPNASGLTENTNQGYADQLYAIERRRIPGLRLVKLGCGGETTTSFLTGHGNEGDALLLGCRPAGGPNVRGHLAVPWVGGSSGRPLPNWILMKANEIVALVLMDQTFPGARPTPSGKHRKGISA